jgi:hypothetical protein
MTICWLKVIPDSMLMYIAALFSASKRPAACPTEFAALCVTLTCVLKRSSSRASVPKLRTSRMLRTTSDAIDACAHVS